VREWTGAPAPEPRATIELTYAVWRAFNGSELVKEVLDGIEFKDGERVTDDEDTTTDERVAARSRRANSSTIFGSCSVSVTTIDYLRERC
jgi:hypothetical protein